jgi:hypothetical protein
VSGSSRCRRRPTLFSSMDMYGAKHGSTPIGELPLRTARRPRGGIGGWEQFGRRLPSVTRASTTSGQRHWRASHHTASSAIEEWRQMSARSASSPDSSKVMPCSANTARMTDLDPSCRVIVRPGMITRPAPFIREVGHRASHRGIPPRIPVRSACGRQLAHENGPDGAELSRRRPEYGWPAGAPRRSAVTARAQGGPRHRNQRPAVPQLSQ